jgi:hypothetical protein
LKLKMIILPRQAWDKHRENSKKPTVFAQVRNVPASTLLWVDETYIDYAVTAAGKPVAHTLEVLVPELPNLLVCKTMSKSHALSGARDTPFGGASFCTKNDAFAKTGSGQT